MKQLYARSFSFRAALLGMILSGISPLTFAQSHRNWTTHPAIAERSLPKYVFAVGDLHGDYERTAELLAGAGLIAGVPPRPGEAKWSAGSAMLVCTGDFIDKYDHALDIIAMFRALEPQARAAGGEIIVTLGNHEGSFLASHGEHKKSEKFAAELQQAGMSPADVIAGRDPAGIGLWMLDLPIGAKVGDWFFCHAGNTGGRSLHQLKADLEHDIDQSGFAAPILADPNSMLEARLHPRQWWDSAETTGLKPAKPEKPSAEKGLESEHRLRKSVEALGCNHLVIGHQPGRVIFADGFTREPGKVVEHFNGLIFLIDTGFSRGADSGQGAILRLHHTESGKIKVETIDARGVAQGLWTGD